MSERFDRFWARYPRKVAKITAQKAFEKINPDDALLEKMLAALEEQGANWKEIHFVPHPASWLNAGRWQDEASKLPEKRDRPLPPPIQAPKEVENFKLTEEQVIEFVCRNPEAFVKGFYRTAKAMKADNPDLYRRVRQVVIDLVGEKKIKELVDQVKKEEKEKTAWAG